MGTGVETADTKENKSQYMREEREIREERGMENIKPIEFILSRYAGAAQSAAILYLFSLQEMNTGDNYGSDFCWIPVKILAQN